MISYMNFWICRIVENNNRNKRNIKRAFEQIAKESHVPLILLYRIIKLVFALIDNLCPMLWIFSTQYPSLITFSLYDEDTIRWNDDMIYLSWTPITFKQQIVEDNIFIWQLQHFLMNQLLWILAFPHRHLQFYENCQCEEYHKKYYYHFLSI